MLKIERMKKRCVVCDASHVLLDLKRETYYSDLKGNLICAHCIHNNLEKIKDAIGTNKVEITSNEN